MRCLGRCAPQCRRPLERGGTNMSLLMVAPARHGLTWGLFTPRTVTLPPTPKYRSSSSTRTVWLSGSTGCRLQAFLQNTWSDDPSVRLTVNSFFSVPQTTVNYCTFISVSLSNNIEDNQEGKKEFNRLSVLCRC